MHNKIIINLNNDLLMHCPRKACGGPLSNKLRGGQVTAVSLFDGTYIGFRGQDLFSVNINIDELLMYMTCHRVFPECSTVSFA